MFGIKDTLAAHHSAIFIFVELRSFNYFNSQNPKVLIQNSGRCQNLVNCLGSLPRSSVAKTPVTPGGVSTALPRSCLIFQSAVRTQENYDIFREKLSVTGSQRPYSHQALLRSSHGVPLRSYRVLGGDSLRSHGAFTARLRRSQRLRHAFMALPLR